MPKASPAIHKRRTRFIREFLIDQNGTQAAIRAGYSEKSAKVTACRLLTDANVRAAIEKGNDKINAKLDLTVERVKAEIARLAYYDPAAYWNEDGTAKKITEIDEDSRRAIAGFECAELFSGNGTERNVVGYVKKFKLVDKNRALETAARCLKMLTDKVEISDTDQVLARLAAGRKRISEAANY